MLPPEVQLPCLARPLPSACGPSSCLAFPVRCNRRLWPVLALGFKDLLLRSNAQNAAIEENQQRLKALSELSQRLQRQNMAELKRRTGDVQRRHVELSNRLLHVTRLLDGLESRLANSLG